ncbi:MAG: phosphoribosyltransferase family protein [Myxococcota bacterium]
MSWTEALLDCVFPEVCGACGAVGRAPLCRVCEDATLDAAPVKVDGFERVEARFEYGGPVALVIQALKFEDRPELGRPLGRWVAPRFNEENVDLVVPMPSTPNRLRVRGYNPAREIARAFGRVRLDVLERIGEPEPQVALSWEMRKTNPEGTFRARSRCVAHKRILVVDDVLTTGATLRAAGRALLDGGAAAVLGAVVARTPGR